MTEIPWKKFCPTFSAYDNIITVWHVCFESAFFLGSYFKKKNRKYLMLYILLREIASLWKRSRFILSIFSILCNNRLLSKNLIFNTVLLQRRLNSSQRLWKFNFLTSATGIMHFSNDFVFKELFFIFLMPHTTHKKELQKAASINLCIDFQMQRSMFLEPHY